MKRDAALAPLSREHHEALILAQLLKKDAPPYRGLPTDIPGKLSYARDVFTEKIEPHFIIEEQVLALVAGLPDSLGKECSILLDEHRELRDMFGKLGLHEQNLAIEMDALGRFLEAHIRKEEREVFPHIQQLADSGLLSEISKLTENR